MALSSGTRLGPYEIIGLLGVGGQGEVYRARDPRLGREVAIKVLPPGSSDDADRARRFEQEARAAGALNHPNVLAVFDVGSQEGSPYIVSELLDGATLREHLSGAALSLRKAIDFAVQVSKGLGAAHARGIVHRDLKPENLLVTRDGRVKILDFGLAKLALPPAQDAEFSRDPTQARHTGPGVVMGTVGYMSPEQVQGRIADHRSDLFSLGTILFEILAGRRAFEKDSAVETMTAVLREDPLEGAPLPSGVPPGLEKIIRHCLEKNPEERFQISTRSGVCPRGYPSSLGIRACTLARARRAPEAMAQGIGRRCCPAGSSRSHFRIGAKDRRTTDPFVPAPHVSPWNRVVRAVYPGWQHYRVYGATWEGAPTHLFSRRIEGRESNRIDLPDADIAALSSTGEMAIMLSYRLLFNSGAPGTLARVPLSGGAPREVLKDVHGADWSPDGQSLCVIRQVESRFRLEFPIGKVLFETSDGIWSPRVSPKGDRVAFLHDTGDGVAVEVVDLTGRKTTLSIGRRFGGNNILWSRDGEEVWFATSDGGWVTPVRAVSLSGEERLVMRLPAWVELQDISPDGRVLMVIGTPRGNTIARPPGAVQERTLSWHESSGLVDISADGKTVLFVENSEGGTPGLYLRKTDGSPAVRLGEGAALGGISRDGGWAIVSSRPYSELQLLPTGAGEPQILSGHGLIYQEAIWFADGGHLLINGREENHRARSYVQDLGGGKPRPLTTEGTVCWVASPDGQRAACTDSDGKGILYRIENGETSSISGLEPGESIFQWSSDGRSLYVGGGGVPLKVFRLDLATGSRELWREISPSDTTALMWGGLLNFRIAPDGKSYAYGTMHYPTHLYLVDGLH